MKLPVASLLLTLALAVLRPGVATALDTVKTGKIGVVGTVQKIDRYEVVVKDRTGEKTISVGDIESIVFDSEPAELIQARADLRNERFAEAMEQLNGVDTSGLRPEIAQEIQYIKAYCATQQALAGEMEILDAGRLMSSFAKQHSSSFHWVEANRWIAELLLADGKLPAAQQYFGFLADAPWPEAKLRSAVGIGRVLRAQKKPAEALAAFDRALTIEAKGEQAETLLLEARLGKAVCQAEAGKPNEGIRLIEDIIAQADAQDALLNARAYNALGACYRAAKQPKDALLAYLHVDLLFFQYPSEHAEALAALSALWNEVHRPDRASTAQQTLRERYPKSPWSQAAEGS